MLASRGLRDLDGGPERITDDVERDALRRIAGRIRLRAALWAAVLTALMVLLPR